MIYYNTNDPVADYNRYDAVCRHALRDAPRCACCEEPINVDRLHYRWGENLYHDTCFSWDDVPDDEEDEVEVL